LVIASELLNDVTSGRQHPRICHVVCAELLKWTSDTCYEIVICNISLEELSF